MIVEPSVKLLAHTVIDDDVIAELMDVRRSLRMRKHW